MTEEAQEAIQEAVRHQTSLAIWDIPEAAIAGEPFSIKAGAKSSADCALAGAQIAIADSAGSPVISGRLGDKPWSGTGALFWTVLELLAPGTPGQFTLTACFDGAQLKEPHEGASATFNVTVVERPQHCLTVTVTCKGTRIDDAIVRLGPYRASTDVSGTAKLGLAKGRYELQVWKSGFEIAPLPVAIDADAAIQIEAHALPEEDPDAIWTA